jgi:glycosyltransferase involved in cell wall biosynthesis
MNKKSPTKSIKVAVLLGQLSVIGGVGIAAVNEVRELRKLGVDAELVILYRKKEFNSIKDFNAFDIPVIFLSDCLPSVLRINFKFPLFSFFSFFHISSIFWAPFLIKKRRYDVILVHETYNCFSAIAAAKLTRAKLVSYLWDPVSYIVPRVYGEKLPKFLLPFLRTFTLFIDKQIFKKSDIVLLGSDLHKETFKSFDNGKPFMILPTGTKVLKTLPQKRNKTIISLTKWDKGKDPEFLLKLAKELKSDFLWLVVGNWSDRNQYREFQKEIKTMGLEGKVKLIGKVTEEEKTKLLSQARVLVHPIVEAFGMFALEAAGCGCPFIIPQNSGVTELFKEGEHGYFPKEGDVVLFSEKLELLLNNEEKALKMGEEAWNQAKKYSWNEHARRLLTIFNQVSK